MSRFLLNSDTFTKHDFCSVLEHKERNVKQYLRVCVCVCVCDTILCFYEAKSCKQKAESAIRWCSKNRCSAFVVKSCSVKTCNFAKNKLFDQ